MPSILITIMVFATWAITGKNDRVSVESEPPVVVPVPAQSEAD
tara:strand:- start:689 stop:817 length:129 start_codon:yes stop_codon:yes gene_type:complete